MGVGSQQTLPQLATCSLNKPFVRLWGPRRSLTRYQPTWFSLTPDWGHLLGEDWVRPSS